MVSSPGVGVEGEGTAKGGIAGTITGDAGAVAAATATAAGNGDGDGGDGRSCFCGDGGVGGGVGVGVEAGDEGRDKDDISSALGVA